MNRKQLNLFGLITIITTGCLTACGQSSSSSYSTEVSKPSPVFKHNRVEDIEEHYIDLEGQGALPMWRFE
ncbi:MAG: hypothetical protein MJ239_04800 [Bacilli bacterium]|nr:hypothetical protein [Bacilli bacterium]